MSKLAASIKEKLSITICSEGGAVNSFHKISLYLLHLNEVLGGEPLDPEMLNFQHPWFRQNGPSSKMTLVRNTLNFIDQ